MGQLVMTVVGGVAGFLVGGPMGAAIGMQLGGMVGGLLFGPSIKGPRLQDLKVTASTYGAAIPEIYGTVRLGTNLIWTSGIKETKHKSGGKGAPKQTTYTYDATFAVGLCRGPITNVLRIWADGKLIWDQSSSTSRTIGGTFGNFDFGSALVTLMSSKSKGKKSVKVRVYRGTEDQLPDSLISAHKGAGNVSAHRGLCYLVFEKLQLDDFGNRIPSITVEVSKTEAAAFPAIAATSSGATSPIYSTWYPDWETGRIYANVGGGSVKVFDLGTMAEMYATPLSGGRTTAFTPSGNSGNYVVPGAGLYFSEVGTGNSRPIEMYEMNGFSRMDTIGKDGSSLGGVFIDASGNLIEQYGALGTAGHTYVNGGTGRQLYYMHFDHTRSVWCFAQNDSIPVFTEKAPFTPSNAFSGRQGDNSSEIIGWRSANNRLELLIYNIPAGSKGNVATDANGSRWTQSSGWSSRTAYLVPTGHTRFTPRVVLYDPTDDCIFAMGINQSGVAVAFKWSVPNNTYKFVTTPANLKPPTDMKHSRIAGGSFGWYTYTLSTGALFQEIDIQTGALTLNKGISTTDMQWGSAAAAGGNQYWDDQSGSLVMATQNAYRRVYFRSTGEASTVENVARAICLRSGVLTNDDLDFTELSEGSLVGYLIDRECSARDALKQLATGYLFDGFESDYRLKLRSRGLTTAVTIPEDWIGSGDDGMTVKETLTQELEMPMRVSVNYYDVARDHQQNTQSAKRVSAPVPTMWTAKEEIMELPITWQASNAKQCAEKILKMMWANRWSYQFTLPWRYMKYDPADIASVQLRDGTTYTMRFNSVNIGADFTMEIDAVSERAAAYVSTAVGSSGDAPVQYIPVTYPCQPFVINTPLLRDIDYNTDGNSTLYLTVVTDAPVFNGAYLYMNAGGGVNFEAIGHISADNLSGLVVNALPQTKSYESTDEQTVLRVRLTDDDAELESVLQEDMLTDYLNAAVVGEEIIQFRDAAKQEDGSWHLSGILRARRGTNYAVNNHKPGERFLLLAESVLIKNSRPPEDYYTTDTFKAVPDTGAVEDAVPYASKLVPRDLMPYTPEDFGIEDDGTTVSITMSRRSRVIDPMRDGGEFIHYREGDKASARIMWSVWAGLTLNDTATVKTPTISAPLPLFDAAGLDIPPVVTFPLASLGGATGFLLKAYETGYADGTPKWMHFERIDTNRWNMTEVY